MILNPFVDIINQVLPEPQAGLLNGILFGIRANMPKNFYEALITTGTVHIVALSGQNISILAKVISEITLRCGRRISIWITFSSIIGFVLFVGFEPTLIRAAIMGSLSLLAVYFGRKDWSLLSLILAAGMMLIVNPSWIDNLSFQLSFLATLGIILLSSGTPLKRAKNLVEEIKNDLLLNLRTTLSAQIFTVPIIFIPFRVAMPVAASMDTSSPTETLPLDLIVSKMELPETDEALVTALTNG